MCQEKATRGEFVQWVDGGKYFVTATRIGGVVTFKTWQKTHNGDRGWANVRTFDGREYGQLGTFETDDYGQKIAEFAEAYKTIELVFEGIRLPLVGRFGFGEIEVRCLTEARAKQITGER